MFMQYFQLIQKEEIQETSTTLWFFRKLVDANDDTQLSFGKAARLTGLSLHKTSYVLAISIVPNKLPYIWNRD